MQQFLKKAGEEILAALSCALTGAIHWLATFLLLPLMLLAALVSLTSDAEPLLSTTNTLIMVVAGLVLAEFSGMKLANRFGRTALVKWCILLARQGAGFWVAIARLT